MRVPRDVWLCACVVSGGAGEDLVDRSFRAQAKLYPSAAEAEAAGDHQALALALAHRAVADAGGAAALALGGDAAAKDRVGVYFGAWQRGGGEGKASAYGALGEALGALPGRPAVDPAQSLVRPSKEPGGPTRIKFTFERLTPSKLASTSMAAGARTSEASNRS